MNRREFLLGSMAAAGLSGSAGVALPSGRFRFLFGACRPLADAPILKAAGCDFIECDVSSALVPLKKGDDWKRQRDYIASLPLPLTACNSFIPGRFRLTGPRADFKPALDYAETVLRRAEEVGVKYIVFGSGGARNVPGDYCAKDRRNAPDTEKGVVQFTEFCRELSKRVGDLQNVTVLVEPLRPRESNIINYVWQGAQVCGDVASPRVKLLADFFHMMMGREPADSIRAAGNLVRHCHIAEYSSRAFPGSDPSLDARYKPFFGALRDIGYSGGISCECNWVSTRDLPRKLEKALAVMRAL